MALLPRYPGATHATATGELIIVPFLPGVTAVLDARTGLRALDGGGRVELLGGRALLATAAEPPGMVGVLARGHELRLRAAAEVELDARDLDLRLAVLTGALDLRPRDLPARRLAGGTGVILPEAGGMTSMDGLSLAEAGVWRRGQLAYHDQTLGAVLRDLERYRGGRILVLGDDRAARRVHWHLPPGRSR